MPWRLKKKSNVCRKYYFLGLLRSKTTFEENAIFDQNHGLTPLEKCKFLNFVKMTLS